MYFRFPTCEVDVWIFVFFLVRSVCGVSSFICQIGVCIYVFLLARPVCVFSSSYL